ncbi:MAG: hypothetical protein KAW16_07800 [candidate division Zixibacteria bacterium]|nr:hypothetical protein [candidate division Zixibacteria bacterium]
MWKSRLIQKIFLLIPHIITRILTHDYIVQMRTEKTLFENIEVVGKEIFREKTLEVLKLLRNKSLQDYHYVSKHLKRIIPAERETSAALLHLRLYSVGNKVVYQSDPEWYASKLVYAAACVEVKERFGVEPFRFQRTLKQRIEKTCVKKQLQVLKRLEAKQAYIDYVNQYLDRNKEKEMLTL